MREIYARKIIDKNGDEIIELDLNKPWPSRMEEKHPTYMGDLEKMYIEKKIRKSSKDFITLLN